MAVTLSLKAVMASSQTPTFLAHHDPGLHFRTFFVPLYSLRSQPNSPVAAVDRVGNFLRKMVTGLPYLQLRLRKYLAARLTIAAFLRRAAKRRKKRLQSAVQRWEAAEPEAGAGAMVGRSCSSAMKAAIVGSLYRTTVHDVLLNARSGVRHARQLTAELATVSRRIAALWLQGQHKAPEVQQLVPRLLGLRQRVQNYTNAQFCSLGAAWRRLGLPEWLGRLNEVTANSKASPKAPANVEALLERGAVPTKRQPAGVLPPSPSFPLEGGLLRRKEGDKGVDVEGSNSHVRRMQQMRGSEVMLRKGSFSAPRQPGPSSSPARLGGGGGGGPSSPPRGSGAKAPVSPKAAANPPPLAPISATVVEKLKGRASAARSSLSSIAKDRLKNIDGKALRSARTTGRPGSSPSSPLRCDVSFLSFGAEDTTPEVQDAPDGQDCLTVEELLDVLAKEGSLLEPLASPPPEIRAGSSSARRPDGPTVLDLRGLPKSRSASAVDCSSPTAGVATPTRHRGRRGGAPSPTDRTKPASARFPISAPDPSPGSPSDGSPFHPGRIRPASRR
eukprot:EG_transcript_7345